MLQQRDVEVSGTAVGAGPGIGIAATVQGVLDQVARGAFRQRPFAVRFWDDSVLAAAVPEPAATVVVRSPLALSYVLRSPDELGLGRAWISGALDVEGDLAAALRWRSDLRTVSLSALDRLRAVVSAFRVAGTDALRRPPAVQAEAVPRGRRHSLDRDRTAVRHHYEVSSAFYRLILGPSMAYSCAYFDSPDDSLEQAQRRKFELICQKLRLKSGDRLLDVGCGWGGLIIHAAVEHGAIAVGVTVSPAQAEVALERVQRAGVGDRCTVHVADYRELDDERFDAIASVGMYEHVGREELGRYARKIRSLLRPGGLFLNHGIARLAGAPDREPTFIGRFVFPDGELHPIADLLAAMHEAGLELRDVESLREHYALTLRRWVKNLESARAAAIRAAGPERERIWRLYMVGAATAFELGELSVFQTLAVRGGARHGLPLNRTCLIGGERGGGSVPRSQPDVSHLAG